MAGYTPPDGTGIPFRFTDAGYVKPTYNPTNADFHPEYTTSDLKAAIQVMGIYQESTYTYKKSCPTYVVGYSAYGVQILKGPCVYGGIRDLGAFIDVKQKEQGSGDITAFLKPLKASQVPFDLAAFIKSYEQLDLPAFIHGFEERNISAVIDTHPPSNIKAYVHVFQRAPEDLPASLYGWQAADLRALLEGLIPKDLPASVYGIPPRNLPAYLKVWPEDYLYANIHGWGVLDLHAYIKGKPYSDLGGFIGVHPWVNLTARLKGWVRVAEKDLSAYIRAFHYRYLSAYVFSYEFKHLGALIIPIPYVPLQGIIHGWQEAYLSAILIGKDYPYNLKASINGVGGFKDLFAYAKATLAINEHLDLAANIHPWEIRDLTASLIIPPYGRLSASIIPVGYGNLAASIFPKMIKLTTILGLVTLDNKDLQAMINVSCGYSMFKNLLASVRVAYKGDIGAYVKGFKFYSTKDLFAKLGRTIVGNTLDKLPINVIIKNSSAMAYDSLPIYLDLFRGSGTLPAYIFGSKPTSDLSASITPARLTSYEFNYVKSKEKVYKRRSAMDRFLDLNKVVEFSFRDIVKEYIYLSAGNKTFAAEFLDKWAMGVKGYDPKNIRLGTKRKLFRAATLYDIRKYKSIDEAVRDMIEFVSWEASSDLNAVINLDFHSDTVMLGAVISPIHIVSTESVLGATITGQTEYSVIVGYEDTVDLIK